MRVKTERKKARKDAMSSKDVLQDFEGKIN